ncbi:MAG: sensor domain-containing diguanylate cyclase [Thermoanaerobaculia bacterium]
MARKLLTLAVTILVLAAGSLVLWRLLAQITAALAGRPPGAWVLAVLMAALGAGFAPAHRWVQRQVDARWFPRKLALTQLEEDLLPELAGAGSMDDVAERFTRSLRAGLGLTSAALFVSDSTGRFYRLRSLKGSSEPSSIVLKTSELTGWRIQWGTRPISRREARDHGLPWPQLLREIGTAYLVPVVFQDELLGLLALGPTRSGKELDGTDLTRLEELAERSSAMLEHARLFALASHDTVTGLSRRRIFQERLAQELVRSRRTLRPFSVALADIDDFKRVNDSWGHPAGDHVLKTISRRLARGCRRSDTVSRIGGEEFAILLPETPLEAAVGQAEKLRAAVADELVDLDGDDRVEVTISFGVFGWQPDEANLAAEAEEIIQHADKALYEAKRTGKNRVVVYRQSPSHPALTAER